MRAMRLLPALLSTLSTGCFSLARRKLTAMSLQQGEAARIIKSKAWNFGPLHHVKAAHRTWEQVVSAGDVVVDATCGNGHDAAVLAGLALTESSGNLYCIDIQEKAIDSTRQRLQSSKHLTTQQLQRVHFCHGSHERFPDALVEESVRLICYNLGYLPGIPRVRSAIDSEADDDLQQRQQQQQQLIITETTSTIKSLSRAVQLLRPGGLLSVTAYRGHVGGQEECSAVESFLSELSAIDWRVVAHQPLNRPLAPVLFEAFKIEK